MAEHAPERAEITVAGINGKTLPETIRRLLAESDYPLFCSESLFELVVSGLPEFDQGRWSSVVPISDCFEQIRAKLPHTPVLVLVSGDPLYYGLGKRLKEQFPDRNIDFLPAVSFMQSCFSHFGLSWDDAETLSLHGRPIDLLQSRLNAPKLFIFTDPDNSPERIAAYLHKHLDEDETASMQIMVGERIGTKHERFSMGGVTETASRSFSHPNCMIVLTPAADEAAKPYRFGLTEDDIGHSRGLITKDEVRAAVIHRLQLPAHGVFWDIGAGSGSISLEAARLFPSLTVYAVEKNDEQRDHIRANRRRYRCRNLHVIPGEAPEALASLKAPDRVFIGGSGGRLEAIVSHLARLAEPPPRVVLTAVLEATARRAPELFHRCSFTVDMSLVQVSRWCFPQMEKKERNPIHIICGRRN